MQAVIVGTGVYQEILDAIKNPNGPKKIQAIKKLRIEARTSSGEGMGLKEAKESIERLMHKLNLGTYPGLEHAATIVCGPRVKSMVVNFGEGDIEVDIEGMQLKVLSSLQTIGLESCGHILELVQAIKAFSDGYRIGIVKEDEE